MAQYLFSQRTKAKKGKGKEVDWKKFENRG